jgi:hypothetical protein
MDYFSKSSLARLKQTGLFIAAVVRVEVAPFGDFRTWVLLLLRAANE